MKKVLSLLVVLALAVTGFAIAESVSGSKTQLQTEAQISAMKPVLDAVAKNAAAYDVENPEAVWNILAKVAENEKGANPTATEEEMFSYAQACFAGMEEMPEVKGDVVSNTADMKGYTVKSVADARSIVVTHYGIDAEGKLYATVNVYDEKNAVIDDMVIELVANETEGAAFPMSVEAVNPDLENVEFVEEHDCHIPYTNVIEVAPTATAEPKELKKGVKGEKVKEMQKRLRKLGYLAMYYDGDFGPRTEEAVKLFQQTAGLKVDGIAGYKTLKALNDKDAPKCPVYIALQKGDSGKRVTELQNALVSRGLLDAKKVTEKYDADTVKAVKAYLDSAAIAGDGTKIDADTVKAIVEIAAEPTVAPTTTPVEPTATPVAPTSTPIVEPTVAPTEEPTVAPTAEP